MATEGTTTVVEDGKILDICWDAAAPLNKVLEMLRSAGGGKPEGYEQQVAILHAFIWAWENPDGAPIVRQYIEDHFPWSCSFSGYRVGDTLTIETALHRTIETMVTSVTSAVEGVVVVIDSLTNHLRELTEGQPESVPDGFRARKGQIQERKHWQQFTKGRHGQSFKTRNGGCFRV